MFVLFLTLITTVLPDQCLQAQNMKDHKTKELLTGTWTLDFDKSILHSSKASLDRHNSFKIQRKSRIKNSFSSRRMTFYENGDYTISATGKIFKGKWNLTEDNQAIVIVLAHGKRVVHKIMKLNPSKLVITVNSNRPEKRFFKVWELNKINK